MIIVVIYTCAACETGGSDLEVTYREATCWCCGAQAVVTARIAVPPGHEKALIPDYQDEG